MCSEKRGRPMRSTSRAANLEDAIHHDIPGIGDSIENPPMGKSWIVPNPLRSEQEAMAFEHRDLEGLSNEDLTRAWARAVVWLGLGGEGVDQEWLYRRLVAIQQERRRRYGQRP